MLDGVSIIIPIAPEETAHTTLLQDLKNTDADIIVSCEGSRAKSMNAGAANARNAILWFLHADSRVSADNMNALDQAIAVRPDALHYFDIQFDHPGLAQLNGAGANLRSRLFGWPYGDQGLCLLKEHFNHIGGYPEHASYGEDLLFVRKAKKVRMRLHPVRSKLRTSARKYQAQGWLSVTLSHQRAFYNLMRQKL